MGFIHLKGESSLGSLKDLEVLQISYKAIEKEVGE